MNPMVESVEKSPEKQTQAVWQNIVYLHILDGFKSRRSFLNKKDLSSLNWRLKNGHPSLKNCFLTLNGDDYSNFHGQFALYIQQLGSLPKDFQKPTQPAAEKSQSPDVAVAPKASRKQSAWHEDQLWPQICVAWVQTPKLWVTTPYRGPYHAWDSYMNGWFLW